MRIPLTNEIFIEKAISIHGNKFNYSKIEYVNNRTKIKILCNMCGVLFEQTPNDHLNGRGCRTCGIKRRTSNMTFSLKDFVERAIILHGNKYSYSKVKYINANIKIIITCLKHNKDFEQTPGHHLDGSGCPKCAFESSAKLNSKSLVDFINESKYIYGDCHNYDYVDYVNCKTKVKLFCNIHQIYFEKIPVDYFDGSSCPECMKNSFHTKMSITTDQFIERAIAVHGIRYDYSKVNYLGSQINILIRCKTHNTWFNQTPNNHISGKGCSECFWLISRQEKAWLDSLNKNLERQKSIKAGNITYRLDGFDPIENIAYEFMGDYWHGNPKIYDAKDINSVSKKSFGELYNKTLVKISALKTVCTDVIVMWESDWNPKK